MNPDDIRPHSDQPTGDSTPEGPATPPAPEPAPAAPPTPEPPHPEPAPAVPPTPPKPDEEQFFRAKDPEPGDEPHDADGDPFAQPATPPHPTAVAKGPNVIAVGSIIGALICAGVVILTGLGLVALLANPQAADYARSLAMVAAVMLGALAAGLALLTNLTHWRLVRMFCLGGLLGSLVALGVFLTVLR